MTILPARLRAVFSSMRFHDCRLLWFAVATANSGRWIMMLGAGSVLYSMTHSSFLVGASFFTLQVPVLFISPLAGTWADTRDRRHLLAMSLALACVASGVLTFLSLTHLLTWWAILCATLLLGISSSIQGTASNALLPSLVPSASLPNAVALQGTGRQGAEFLGPLLASPLLVVGGPAAVFGLAFVCNLMATLLPYRMEQGPKTVYVAPRRPFDPLREGLRYLKRAPVLRFIMLLVALHCSLTMTYQALLPEFVHGLMSHGGATGMAGGGMAGMTMDGADAAYGMLMTMVGLGAIVGTLTLAAMTTRAAYNMSYVVSALGSGAALLLLGMSPIYPVALVAAFSAGATQAVFMAVSLLFLQERAADAFRGRVTSVYSFFAGGTMAAMSWGSGGMATIIAPGTIMMILGGAFVAFVAFAAYTSAAFQTLSRPVRGPLAIVPPLGVSNHP